MISGRFHQMVNQLQKTLLPVLAGQTTSRFITKECSKTELKEMQINLLKQMNWFGYRLLIMLPKKMVSIVPM
ncbi:hypothetical protein D3C85_1067140 [compost metagenome]